MSKKYKVAKNKSIITKAGIVPEGKDVTPIMIGPNFNALIRKGTIVETTEEEIIENEPDNIVETETKLDLFLESINKTLEKFDLKNREESFTGSCTYYATHLYIIWALLFNGMEYDYN